MFSSSENPNHSHDHRAQPEKSCPGFEMLVSNHRDLAERFYELTQQLCKKFDINKGVLVLRLEDPRKLAVVSTWKNGLAREGLAINLPCDTSLFERVAEQGQVYTENFCDSFPGNFFERKLLLDDSSRSFVLQPLKSKGRVVGLLGYSSEGPTAFTMFEEGLLNEEANALASFIETRMYHPAERPG